MIPLQTIDVDTSWDETGNTKGEGSDPHPQGIGGNDDSNDRQEDCEQSPTDRPVHVPEITNLSH